MELEKVRQKLQEEKQGLLAQIAGLEKTLQSTLGESISELSVCDNHPADIGDELFERSKDIALRDNAQVILERVNGAFAKMDDGTYGYCDVCNEKIPLERLEALPWATECLQCQSKEEVADRADRPLEELVLAPPFQRTFLDEDPLDSLGFDGEDALQAVMLYGSSDTPQDVTGSHDYDDVFLNSHEQEESIDSVHVISQGSHGERRSSKEK